MHMYDTAHSNEIAPMNVSHQVKEDLIILTKNEGKYLWELRETRKKQTGTLNENKIHTTQQGPWYTSQANKTIIQNYKFWKWI